MSDPSGPVLRDIHLPPPPSWWPPAPGWWILAAIILLIIFFALWKIAKYVRLRRYRKNLQAKFEAMIAAWRTHNNPALLAAAFSAFARRLLRQSAPQSVALNGRDWLAQLDQAGNTDAFTQGIGQVLLDAPWQAQADYDVPALIALMRRWTQQAVRKESAHA